MIIQKSARHQEKTVEMKLEMFDVLLDAYMELVREKQLQDKDYKPKVIVISRKHMVVKKPTNFDKITSSVDALAEFLVENDKEITYFDDYEYWDYINEQPCYNREEAKQSIIEWLEQECENQ